MGIVRTQSLVLLITLVALSYLRASPSPAAASAPEKVTESVSAKGWELLSDSGQIKTWRKEVEGSPVIAFKGEAVIDASIAKVGQVLADISRDTEWMAEVVETKLIRQINDFDRVEYNHTGTPFILKDRDFVFLAQIQFDLPNRTMVIKIKSIEDPLAPVGKFVRGELVNSIYVLKCTDASCAKTNVSVEIHADPKGTVPKWIVNLFQKAWPKNTLKGIQAQVAKADVPEHAKLKEIFEGKYTGPALPAVTAE